MRRGVTGGAFQPKWFNIRRTDVAGLAILGLGLVLAYLLYKAFTE